MNPPLLPPPPAHGMGIISPHLSRTVLGLDRCPDTEDGRTSDLTLGRSPISLFPRKCRRYRPHAPVPAVGVEADLVVVENLSRAARESNEACYVTTPRGWIMSVESSTISWIIVLEAPTKQLRYLNCSNKHKRSRPAFMYGGPNSYSIRGKFSEHTVPLMEAIWILDSFTCF